MIKLSAALHNSWEICCCTVSSRPFPGHPVLLWPWQLLSPVAVAFSAGSSRQSLACMKICSIPMLEHSSPLTNESVLLALKDISSVLSNNSATQPVE